MPTHEIAWTEGARFGFLFCLSLVCLARMLLWCWSARVEIRAHVRHWVLACLNRKDEE